MRFTLLVLLVLAGLFLGVAAAAHLGWARGPVVITREDEQKIIFFLNEARRVTEPGLDWMWPFFERAQRYDRRWLYLNTEPDRVITKDGEQLTIDNYAIWRIEDAIQFRRSFPQGMLDAEKRIDRNVRDDVREVLGRHTLTEVLKDRRAELMAEITRATRGSLQQFGIEVADVRINRTDLPDETMKSVYARMTTERERQARKNRAEGEEAARRIRADADREARIIVAEAKRDAEIVRGGGDAEATRIYAEAYGSDPEFFDFMRSLEAYRKTIDAKTMIITSPDNEFFRFLESTSGEPRNGGTPR